jgi:dTDP-4-dehydrorhamnose 3,5-epimerase
LLWVPPGFALEFYVTREVAEFQYNCTDCYAPEHERCIRWEAPILVIEWALVSEPVVSEKDRAGVALREASIPVGAWQ